MKYLLLQNVCGGYSQRGSVYSLPFSVSFGCFTPAPLFYLLGIIDSHTPLHHTIIDSLVAGSIEKIGGNSWFRIYLPCSFCSAHRPHIFSLFPNILFQICLSVVFFFYFGADNPGPLDKENSYYYRITGGTHEKFHTWRSTYRGCL